MCSNYWLKSMLTAAVLLCSTAVSSPAQWVNHRDPLTPRKGDGKPDLSAPAPKTPDGKPDLSGIWQADDLTHFFDLNADHQQPEVPFQPWAKALSEQRRENLHKDDPLSRCMPPGVPRINTIAPFKIIQTPRVFVALYETTANSNSRRLFSNHLAPPPIPYP